MHSSHAIDCDRVRSTNDGNRRRLRRSRTDATVVKRGDALVQLATSPDCDGRKEDPDEYEVMKEEQRLQQCVPHAQLRRSVTVPDATGAGIVRKCAKRPTSIPPWKI